MLRLLLLLILITFIARAFWRVVDGVIEGMRGGTSANPSSGAQRRSVHMARDPVCGTFVVPERAVVLANGDRQLYFCSTRCRDAFRTSPSGSLRAAAPADGARTGRDEGPRPEPIRGRTA